MRKRRTIIGKVPTFRKKCIYCHSWIEAEIRTAHAHILDYHLDELDLTSSELHDFIHGISIERNHL